MTGTPLPLLHDIRVLDFCRYIARPYCAAMLAEYGADVIRIEKRDGGEDRFPAQVGGGVGALFLQMNRNKRSTPRRPTASMHPSTHDNAVRWPPSHIACNP